MKKLLLSLFVLFASFSVFAQTDGLSYQAIIIDPNPQEIPGVDVTGNVLINTPVSVRFTITQFNGTTEYQEVHNTTTDAFGMINLIIGQGNPQLNSFTEIFWDGTRKDLKVEINLDGNYKDLSNQELLFVPYAFHRDIIATGYLTVDGEVNFRGNLEVDGTTDLNSSLSVNNQSPSNLNGSLTVDGGTQLNNGLLVENESPTELTGTLTVNGITRLRNSLEVDGNTLLNSRLEVNQETTLNSSLDVTNESPTALTGTLGVVGETNLNSDVNINNGSDLNVSGNFNVEGNTFFNNDLTVNGNTNLNNELNVNNNSPTYLSGELTVEGDTKLTDNLQVLGITNLESELNVNNLSPTDLSGKLTVNLETNLNSGLNVNNGSPTYLSGPLNVEGLIALDNDLTVEGITNLNNSLSVNNGSPTTLSGILTVQDATQLNNTLEVNGATTLNNTLDVTNGSATNLTGTLEVTEATILNNTLDVTNGSATNLTGTLDVTEATTLNNSLEVTNGSATNLTGTLTVDEATTLNNTLQVANGSQTTLTGALSVDQGTSLNSELRVGSSTTLTGTLEVVLATTLNNTLDVLNGSATNLTGTLNVDGATNINNTVAIDGATLISNSLTVTGATSLGSISTETLNVVSNKPNHIATFENQSTGDGDGLKIKLGKTHGAYNGNMSSPNPGYLYVSNPGADQLSGPLSTVKGWLNGGSFTPTQLITLVPTAMSAGAFIAIGNEIFNQINTQLGLPKSFPSITLPAIPIIPATPIFGGVTVPVVNIHIPGWSIPEVTVPPITIPGFPLIPSIPNIPVTGLPQVGVPTLNFTTVSNSLTKENVYVSFEDKDGRVTGSIKAQSTADFRDNTVLDDVYVLNVVSSFVGIDLLDGVTSGIVEITNLIDAYNEIGVEYSSGNGDYAEWLERINVEEYLTAGDIVAVKGGKITKDLTEAEQIMVVSHKPIILGNAPKEDETYLGNNIAFMGQVPVKVMGPVKTGDYIVASTSIKGYGVPINPNDMTSEDFKYSVGRSWEENLLKGPKMVNTVVGVHNGDWAKIIMKIDKKQKEYEAKFKLMEAQVDKLDQQANDLLLSNHKD
jgi:hypothetical protein